MKSKFLMGAILALAMFSADAHAQNTARPSVRGLKSLDLPLAKGPLAQPQAQTRTQSGVSALSSVGPIIGDAPALTQVFVYAVGSTNCGWEYMTTVGQASTTCDHGGDQLRTAVVEIGYGANPTAWMNGLLQLPAYANYTTLPICIIGSYYSWACPASYTIVGFLRLYAADGFQDGLFGFQDTSANTPFNTMYTQINIL